MGDGCCFSMLTRTSFRFANTDDCKKINRFNSTSSLSKGTEELGGLMEAISVVLQCESHDAYDASQTGDSSPGLRPHDLALAYKSSEGSLLSQQIHFEIKIEIGKLKLLLPPWTMFKIKPGTVSFAEYLLQLLHVFTSVVLQRRRL